MIVKTEFASGMNIKPYMIMEGIDKTNVQIRVAEGGVRQTVFTVFAFRKIRVFDAKRF
jgi:hypothetical protein